MICKHCDRELPVEMFLRNPRSKSGRAALCLDCHKQSQGYVNPFKDLILTPDTYIEEANPPRTLVESFMNAEWRRHELERRSSSRNRIDGLVPIPKG